MKKILIFIFLGTSLALNAAPKKILSPIISAGVDGKLAYDVDARGNRVLDFSTAGYFGGDQPIPAAPVRVIVSQSMAMRRRASRRRLITSAICPPM